MELVALAPFSREKAKKEVSIFTCSNRAVALFEQVKPSGNGIAMATRKVFPLCDLAEGLQVDKIHGLFSINIVDTSHQKV
jgi:hypothetical protein